MVTNYPADLKFLIVQFAEGSAGLFLTSLLSSSQSIGHFDQQINTNKTNDSCLEFVKTKFTTNLESWLLNEPRPHVSFNLHFISTKFKRGDELTDEEFFQLCQTTAHEPFWQIAKENKRIPIAWHKKIIPTFFKNPLVITILLDPASHKWWHRASWYKKYGIKNSMIHIKGDDPAYNPSSRAIYLQKFQNPYLVDQHPFTFIKNNILKSEYKNLFETEENFNDGLQREFITLSEILDVNKLEVALNRICNRFSFDTIDHMFLIDSWNHWRSCHDSFMPKYSQQSL